VFVGAAQPSTPEAIPAPAAQEPDDGNYADGESCFACHDIESEFKKNPHFRSWNDEGKDWSEKGCQTCHGPAEAHIEGGGDTSEVFSYSDAKVADVNDQCLDCHLEETESQSNFLRNEHGLNSVACTSCHTIHVPEPEVALLKKHNPGLCYDCHGEVKAQFNKPYRHKIHEGSMNCADCHDQHGGYNQRQLRSASGNFEACVKCHSDKQGPFVFEHAPVRVDGCSSCHDPHGSTNARMLKRSQQRILCMECHANTVGVPGPEAPGFHNQTSPGWQSCTTCHTEIHGSNLSPVFFVD
jgi:DmsE family decaheme c-type cytochrome